MESRDSGDRDLVSVTVADLCKQYENKVRQTEFGDWKVGKNYVTYRNGRYTIPFRECATSGRILDWIAQISGKTWGTAEIVGDLVKALDEAFDLQANVCGADRNEPTAKHVERCRRRSR